VTGVRHLAVDWIELCRRVGARGDVAGAGAALLGRWAEQHRGYHDLAHLDEVLARVATLAEEADDADTVRLAAWFHDAVYEPTQDDNEEQSAELATTTLSGLDVAPSRVADVARLVRLTATHDVDPDDRDGAVLCDADLAILASDELRYSSYVEGVRREYAHVDDGAFATGRARVLATLLDRPTLFRTVYGRARWEQPARANAGAELERLRAT
jgi:predicted metal-dependent HD superfamily phosphohydrolase